MSIPKLIERFTQPGEPRRSAVRAIGLEMSKKRSEVLDEISSHIARTPLEDTEFDQGYRCAVLDLLAAYEACLLTPEQESYVLNMRWTHFCWAWRCITYRHKRK